jgi:hypothetical protein
MAYWEHDGRHPYRSRDALSRKYVVIPFQSWSFETDLVCLQLAKRRRDRDGLFSDHALDHALLRIVRLTIETNVMTGTYTLARQLELVSTHVQPPWELFHF